MTPWLLETFVALRAPAYRVLRLGTLLNFATLDDAGACSTSEPARGFNDLQYPTDIVLMAVLWRLRYKLGSRAVAELLFCQISDHGALQDRDLVIARPLRALDRRRTFGRRARSAQLTQPLSQQALAEQAGCAAPWSAKQLTVARIPFEVTILLGHRTRSAVA